jgi:hypothetical protein
MKIILATLIILLTMPISYAMLDEAVRKIRIRRPVTQKSE